MKYKDLEKAWKHQWCKYIIEINKTETIELDELNNHEYIDLELIETCPDLPIDWSSNYNH